MDFISLTRTVSFQPDRIEGSDAWVGHIPFAAWFIRTINPSVLVELGTYTGNSYLAFCQSVKENNLHTQCYAVDTWKGDAHSGFYGEEVYHDFFEYHEKRYSNFSRLLRMTFDEAASSFADGSIELLHIDGFHTYAAVKHDFETWLPKLSPHAIVMFHDVIVREQGYGVWRLWNELSRQYPLNFEFIHSQGLGVLQLSPGKGDFDLEWIRQDYEHRQLIREFFACLGMRVLENYRLRETSRSLKLITKSAEKYRAEINIARLSGAEREQKLGSLHVQLDTYQDQIKAYQDRLKSCQDQMKTYQDQLKAYETQMKEQEHAYQAKFETEQQHLLQREQILQDLNSKLLEIYSSTTWKMMQKLRPIRLWLIPAGSHREKFIQRGITWFLSRGSMDRKS